MAPQRRASGCERVITAVKQSVGWASAHQQWPALVG